MSFLSRKPARPEGRGRADQYDDYDDYAHDGYQSEDDGWSPNEYFSPEGIKGKWAGEQPDGRSGGRGGRTDNGRGDAGYDSYGNDFSSAEYGGQGYGADEIATGLYDLPDGADEDRGDRNRRRRSRDREDRGERTGILRLRRDRGEDIWPDDGISDEDYWASVAADRPLNGTDSPPDNVPPAGGAGLRPGPDSRPGIDARPGMSGPDSRFGGDQRGGDQRGGDQRGGERGVTGRLGPPPGLAADYKPGSGALGGPSQPGGSSRTGSGPMPARSGTGPHPVRPGTGPTPTVGVTSSRPLAAPTGMRPGPAQPGPGASGSPQPAPRPSFQPTNGYQPGGAPPASRPQDRSDWGDRTERIERVNVAGYPEPRPASRSQGHGPAAGRGASGPLGLGTGASATQGRGRNDGGAWRAPERPVPDRQAPERQPADRWEPGRDSGRETSGSWPAPVPPRGGPAARTGTGTGTDDDPLTSKAYSRAATTETDGRSYRAAAHRSQAQTKLTDQAAETFISGQYQASRSGEYWQYRDDAQPSAGRYPAPGSQGPGGGQGGHQAQPGRGPAGPGQGPGPSGQPSQPGRNPGRPGPPGAGSGLPGGQYEAQQPRPSQQQRQQSQRQPGQQQGPTAGPASGGPGGPSAAGPSGGRAAGTGGLNPYDSTASGSYPYPSQPFPARPAPANPAQDSADDPYYRPSAPDGYGTGSASQGRTDQSRGGYGNDYRP